MPGYRCPTSPMPATERNECRRPTPPVRVERDQDVAFVVIDNPPINAGSTEVRRGLLDAVECVQRDDAIVGAC